MEKMDRVINAITDYISENGQEYHRLLISKTFHNALKKEAEKHDSKVDLPRLEVTKRGLRF